MISFGFSRWFAFCVGLGRPASTAAWFHLFRWFAFGVGFGSSAFVAVSSTLFVGSRSVFVVLRLRSALVSFVISIGLRLVSVFLVAQRVRRFRFCLFICTAPCVGIPSLNLAIKCDVPVARLPHFNNVPLIPALAIGRPPAGALESVDPKGL